MTDIICFNIKFIFVVIFSLVCAHYAHASENSSQQKFNQQLKNALSVADAKTHSVYVVGGTLLASNPVVCAPDNIVFKSILETTGYALGACQADLSKLDYKEAGEHFVINCLVREVGTVLSAKGYSFDPLVASCNYLPARVKSVVAPVVTQGVQVATHPETITIATLYLLNNVVVPYLEKSKK